MLRALWTDQFLDVARQEGDALADRYAQVILDPPGPKAVAERIAELMDEQASAATALRDALESGESAVGPVLERQSELWKRLKRSGAIAGTFQIRQALRFSATAMQMAIDATKAGELEGALLAQTLAGGALEKAHALAADAQKPGAPWISGDERRRLYNHLIDICNKLLQAPELLLGRSSEVAKELELYPPAITDYFAPMECPAWVDEEKLRTANRIWNDNMVSILFVLYAASLPLCYIIQRGIPMLYKSGKLAKPENIFQRIYETGLMLDSAMGPGGLAVVQDLPSGLGERFVAAVNQLRPDLGFKFTGTNEAHWEGSGEDLPQWDDVLKKMEEMQGEEGYQGVEAKRLLHGRGLIHARKVRLLHSAMRYMALHPGCVPKPASEQQRQFHPSEPYDVERLGYPVNQEDMAYTLLTFSYAIPRGLAHWGNPLSQEEREAFLHCWKVVGYVMGIREDLLVDDWDQAEDLFNKVKARQGGSSPEGVALTETLCGFLESYLPDWHGLNESLPGIVIKDQVGSDVAAIILSEKRQKDASAWYPRAVWFCARIALRMYFLVKRVLFKRSRLLRTLLGDSLHQAGVALYESWRGPFDRRAFFLPQTLGGGWKKEAGVGKEYTANLRRWRKRLFNTVATGLGAMVLGSVAILVGVVAWFILGGSALILGLGIGVAAYVIALVMLTRRLARVASQRPKLASESTAQ